MSGNRPELPSNILDALQIFANTCWHNHSAFQRTHHSSTSRDVEYLGLQDHSIAVQYLFGSALAWYNKILVRDEYCEALQALETGGAYRRGAYIIGQPGIGKTSFLIYVLIERLREHKPVAVQLRASDPFYAFFTHTCTLYSLSDPSPLVQPDVWALSDLRVSTTTPLNIFLDVSAKVIQATPPSVKYWERWSRHRGADMFVMDVWSVEEIADLSSLLGIDTESMTALATRWGGVPRTLLQQFENDASQQEWELHRAATRVVDNYATLLPALQALDAQDAETASVLFFVHPLKDGAGNVCRRRYAIHVPTRTLEHALAVALQQMQSKARIDFFLLMSVHPGTRICARNIYVRWFYSLAASGRPFRFDWQTVGSDLRSALRYIRAGQLRIVRDTKKITLTYTPLFWIAPRGEFPGVDCALITEERIVVIQVTMAFQPSSLSPQVGLDKLRSLLMTANALPRGFPWSFHYIGISEELVRKAFMHHQLTNVSVERSVVDPAEVGIPDKAYTEGDDLGSRE